MKTFLLNRGIVQKMIWPWRAALIGLLVAVILGLLGATLTSATTASRNANRQWAGAGPMATGLGDLVVTSLAAAPGGSNVLYLGTLSGTVFRSDAQPAAVPAVPLLLLLE